MNRYRNAPTLSSSSKATPTTLCQKCLKRGHYSFECKVSAQERPYITRPSRTQQLANPKLRPKLANIAPVELLKPKESDSKHVDDSFRGLSRKPSRSPSPYSTTSISTISTRRSSSRSPVRRDSRSPRRSLPHKRRASSEDSYSSSSPRRRDSVSPIPDYNKRTRRHSYSPNERGRSMDPDRRGSWRRRTSSPSMDRSRIARTRRSMTTRRAESPRRNHQYPPHQRQPREQRDGNKETLVDRRDRRVKNDVSRRDRSLSPYSKRLALTQAMNMGK